MCRLSPFQLLGVVVLVESVFARVVLSQGRPPEMPSPSYTSSLGLNPYSCQLLRVDVDA
jgi:hypothetical protein